jgi:hypothetical protein
LKRQIKRSQQGNFTPEQYRKNAELINHLSMENSRLKNGGKNTTVSECLNSSYQINPEENNLSTLTNNM